MAFRRSERDRGWVYVVYRMGTNSFARDRLAVTVI